MFEPFSTLILTNPLGVELVGLLRAVEKGAHERIHTINRKHEPDNEYDEGHIDDRADRLEQSRHDHLELRIVRDDSQGPDHAQHSEDFKCGDIRARQHHINVRCYNNEEVKFVPAVAQVATFVHGEAQGDHLKNAFDIEQVVEDVVELVADDFHGRVIRLVYHVRLHRKLDRTQRNQQHDKALKVVVFLNEVDVSAETALSTEEVQ